MRLLVRDKQEGWGELRGEEEEEGGRRQKLSEKKGEGAKFSFMSASSHCFGRLYL
ncbi:hypothetical protein LINPERHAP1_LOCUS22504 [Linum perenne]